MTLRKIVKIDEDKCNGCGVCAPSCAEGAIQIVNGKARLVSENLCDGLGACLGDCPEGAITIEEREADDFDEQAVDQHLGTPARTPAAVGPHGHGGCPGARVMTFDDPRPPVTAAYSAPSPSQLRQWPVQLHLVPPTAPYFRGADVILAADCVAFSIGDFHGQFLKGRSLAIACPKLDDGQEVYLQKLVALIDEAKINTLIVMIMEVPCCGGLLGLAKQAASQAKRKVPVKAIKISLQGEVLSEDWI